MLARYSPLTQRITRTSPQGGRCEALVHNSREAVRHQPLLVRGAWHDAYDRPGGACGATRSLHQELPRLHGYGAEGGEAREAVHRRVRLYVWRCLDY